jgi:ribosomal protein S18 acetylase RimI-like enzyme
VRIEDLTEPYYAAAIAIWHAAGLTRPWNDPAYDLRFAMDGPASTVLGAFDGETLVGTAMTGHDGHRGWVYYLGVLPDRQRHGVGRALMGAVEQWLRERGVPALNLMVRASNEAALGFYDRLGYETVEVVVRARRLG